MFIDKVTIYAKAGNGGNGAVSFHREKYVAKGGPDGGDGGKGGDIVFEIDEGTNTLLDFRYKRKFIAGNGDDGKGSKFHGKNAEDLIIKVPPGTVIRDAKTGKIIKDMSSNERFVYLRGGKGGWGNKHFATPTRQIPRFAKNGIPGPERELTLELKMLADVGLIGLPSVGKSSLLSVISAAKPKIAAYHFTTLSPNLGVVRTGEGKGFVAADIPGLIEGASDGLGLGHAFLRHVDRCRLLIHVVDVSQSEGRDVCDDIRMINQELANYSEELAGRPQIIAANKSDLLPPEAEWLSGFEAFVREKGWPLVYISTATMKGIRELLSLAESMLSALPPITVYEPETDEETEMLREPSEELTIRNENGVYYVEGEWLYRLMGRINFDDRESLSYFQLMMKKKGIFDKMEAAGIRDGDTVNLYDFEFEYVK